MIEELITRTGEKVFGEYERKGVTTSLKNECKQNEIHGMATSNKNANKSEENRVQMKTKRSSKTKRCSEWF